MPHYCKICGEYKSNESFSGRGHAQHICKKCRKLPATVREERMTLSRIYELPFRLNKGERNWLERLKTDSREKIRKTAESEWNMRFALRETSSQSRIDDEEDELLLEVFGSAEEEHDFEPWIDDPEYHWLYSEGIVQDPDWEPQEDYDLDLPF